MDLDESAGLSTDRRLRPALGLPLRRARLEGRIDRLVHVPPVRGAPRLCPPARLGQGWVLPDRAGHGRVRGDQALLARDKRARDPFETPDGVITLTDCFSVKTGTGHPEHRLIRHVRCDQGEVRVKAKFEPRFDYGVTQPRLEQVADDLVLAYGGPDTLVLQTDLGIGTAEISACETAQ